MNRLEFDALVKRIRQLEAKNRLLLSALEKAESALDACRVNYECRGDYFDGYATQAEKTVRDAIAAAERA